VLESVDRLPVSDRRRLRQAERVESKMQMRDLRPGLLRARRAPSELLFEQAESLFDLLTLSVVRFGFS
jgi:hypothetical protein